MILYLNSLTQNVYIAEELMEETFVKLLVIKPRFSARYSFKTWLYTIGRNTAIDYLRRSVRSVSMTAEEMQNILSEEESLEQSYIREEEKIVVHRAMNQLNANYRQVLYLMFFEDFSTEQIAAVRSVVPSALYTGRLCL